MLASKFVAAEIRDHLRGYRDENMEELNKFEIEFLATFAEKIIEAYEKYRYYVKVDTFKDNQF